MRIKTTFLLALSIGLLFTISQGHSETDPAKGLQHAQEALTAGDYETAFVEFKIIAEEKASPLAQFTLGLFYQMGWGRPVNPAEACRWFEKAAPGGIPAAQHLLGDCLVEGAHRPADPSAAAGWYTEAARLGHYTSLCSLAELYMTGNGVPLDPVRGLVLCRQAAESASVPAQVQLGRFLLEGHESVRDFDEAFHWFNLAARKNSEEAQYYLAVMVRDGIGRPKAPDAARQWFELAASHGFVPAYFPTAQLYFHSPVDPDTGKLSEHDLAKAYLWNSATVQGSKDPEELAQATEMLVKLRKIMPQSWIPALDAKVTQHFSNHPPRP